MATFTAIQNKKQSAGAMRGVLDYVVSAPVIKCKKAPRKKCSLVAKEAKKR